MSGEANADQAGLAREAYDNAKLAADGERNAVFGNLVTGDNDIVGLVAYSIYKQNKHDWLIAFEKAKGRGPNDDEAQCYIIGESTPRRLSTYRHLAQATLDGRGPEVTGAPSSESFTQRGYAIARRNNAASAGSGGAAINYLGWLVAALLALVAAYLAYRYAGVGK
jgi:hypothetical protein